MLFHSGSWPEHLPPIAQLVERRTVEALLISLGRWLESGSKEFFTLFSFSLTARIFFLVFLLTLLHAFYFSKCNLVNSTSNSSICNVCPLICFSGCFPFIMIAHLIEPKTAEVWVENFRSLVGIWLEGIPFY